MIQIELTLEDDSKYKLSTNDMLKIFPCSSIVKRDVQYSLVNAKPSRLKDMIEEKKAKEVFMYNTNHDHYRILFTKHKDFNLSDLIDAINNIV